MILIVSEWWQVVGMQAGTAIECPETGEVWQQAQTPITLATASKMRDSCFDRCYIIIPRGTVQPPVPFTVEVRRV